MVKPKVPSADFDESGEIIRSLSIRQREFYELIGLRIKEWAKVEDRLFQLCEFALKSQKKQVAIVYYRTPSIDSRLKLVGELVLSILPQRAKKNDCIRTQIHRTAIRNEAFRLFNVKTIAWTGEKQ